MFIYKEDSFLNSGVVKTINYIALILLIVISIGLTVQFSYMEISIAFVGSLFASYIIVDSAVHNTEFGETLREYEKRGEYKFMYLLIEIALCYALGICIVVCIKTPDWWMPYVPIAILVFNICNVPTLHCWFFKEDL